jgi:ATP-dependent RNA helicase HelY
VTTVDSGALRAAFLAGYGFGLDDFQLRALDAVDAGASVLVAAPTSSGKTLVAEYAIARALAEGTKAFYTAPIKALSNQKYADLVRRHGPANVGLLTGDNAINGDAPVVVMTTEVLRNMIYAGSDALRGLRYVILDEVHYLQDAYRGPVWEEVIIHTPQSARLVCLSATVSNAEELSDWMSTVRGTTATIIEERRPVELQNLYLIGDRTSDRLHLLPTLVDGRPNPEASRLDAEAARSGWPGRGRSRRRLYTPRRIEVVELLEDQGMLPAIYFIFSRAACSDAAAACLDAGVKLTTAAERDRIREIVGARLRGIDDADLAVLGYGRWMAALEAGVAPHHAGLVPPFKEAVEACFVEGLVKVVFATETLALGINMPARSVVIEKLSKFTGERHQFLTPGEYTQLTGRAGRRGIDTIGHAIVLWSPFVPFDQVAGLASSRTFRLTSAFRPTYNMAANLVRTYPRDQAHHLLNLSFGQYQADRDVVRLEARLERRRAALASLREKAYSPYGDIEEYRHSRPRRERRPDGASADQVAASLARLKPGDVIMLTSGKHAGRAAVLTVAQRRGGGVKVRVITPHRLLVSLSEPDFDEVVSAVGSVELPTPFAPNRQSYQREVARQVERARLKPELARLHEDHEPQGDGEPDPILRDPQLDERLRASAQAERVGREVRELEQRIGSRVGSLARRFDRVVRILELWGYLEDWTLTDAGERLASLFHESDLLLAEAIGQKLLDDLDPAAMAGLVSCFTYEHRSPEAPPAPWFPSNKVRDRWRSLAALANELNEIEDEAGLELTRPPEPTFLAIAHAWAAGESLDDVLEDEDLSAGDFVRNMKQVIDLLGQIADVTDGPTAGVAREAAARLFRGVVAASSTVATSE